MSPAHRCALIQSTQRWFDERWAGGYAFENEWPSFRMTLVAVNVVSGAVCRDQMRAGHAIMRG